MSIGGKLKKWQQEGLITAAQQDAILGYERKNAGLRWKLGFAGAGIFSVLLGLSLIIAANWQDIPNTLKFYTHLGVNGLLTWLVWRWRNDASKKIHSETALFLLWGLTLTFIALIGQIFQLGGESYEALRLWFWLTTPMILLYAQGNFLARLWAVVFVIYVPYDFLNTVWDWTTDWNIRKSALMGMALLLPLGIWHLGRWPRLEAARDVFAEMFRRLGVLMAVFFASLASIEFYDGFEYRYHVLVPVFFAAASTALWYGLPRLCTYNDDERKTVDLLTFSGLFVALAFLFDIEGSLPSMLHFIAFWSVAGALWKMQGNERLVSLAVTFISLRLFIGFVEIFDGLMESGFGFVVIGIVMLAFGWVTRKIQKWLAGGAA